MGLAPSRNDENPGKSAVAKVPVPIFSQPRSGGTSSCIVDEFQNFTTGSFASVLSEARKFRLSLIVAHQHLAQLNDDTADAVWGNVGSMVAFQVGSDDAEMIAQQLGKFAGQITPENLSGLPKYTAYARLLIDGIPSNPFSLQTLPPRAEAFDPQRAEIIRRVMRRRFAHGDQPMA
jgi:hypothetical protein